MDVAALVTWLITVLVGVVLLAGWAGAVAPLTEESVPSRFAPRVVYGHFLLATAGLVLWMLYVVSGAHALAWPTFAVLALVTLLGLTLFRTWLPQVRGDAKRSASPTAEAKLPLTAVAAHGLLAAATLVLVLFATIKA